MPPVPFDVFMTVALGLLAILWGFMRAHDAKQDARLEKLEERAHANDLAHKDLVHDIDSNADRSDHQDSLLSVALGGKVSTQSVRRAGVQIDSEPPSSPMLMRPRATSRGRFGD